MDTLFSVITISKNNAEGLAKTIRSVVSQTYKNYEYIVINGSSDDDSRNILNQYKDYISFCCSEPDSGIYNAMNKGVSHSTGKYLLFMNAGDTFNADDVLEKVEPQLENKDIVSGYAINEKGKYETIHEKNILMLLLHSTLSHQATFIKRELFNNYRYDEDLRFIADWKAWVEWIIMENRSFKYIDTIVANFDTNGISSNRKNYPKILEERDKILQDLLPPLILECLSKYHMLYLSKHMEYVTATPISSNLTCRVLKKERISRDK